MKDKREFVEHCVLVNGMQPEAALQLWNQTNRVLINDLDLSVRGEALEALRRIIDDLPDSSRKTVFALFQERCDFKTGAMAR